MPEKSYLSAIISVAFGFGGGFFFLTCPFKAAEGEREGFWHPWADAGAQSEGAGPPAVNRGETGDVGALHPSSPITSGPAASPTEGVCFPGVMSLGMLDR